MGDAAKQIDLPSVLDTREQRLALQNSALVKLARRRFNPQQDKIEMLSEIIKVSAETLGVERAGVWLLCPDHSKLECIVLYQRSTGCFSYGTLIDTSKFPKYFEAIDNERALSIADAVNDPRTLELAESYLKPLGICSLLDAPIHFADQRIGIVCHEHLASIREWELDEQTFVGSIADMVANILEAIELKRLEHESKEQREFLRTVIDAAPNLIFVKDWEGRFILANQAVAQIYDTSVSELIGKRDQDFSSDTNEVEHFLNDDREVMSSGCSKIIDSEPVTNPKTGETRWYQTIKRPLPGCSKEDARVLGVSSDITAIKLAEGERQRIAAETAHAGRLASIGELAAGVAHEINNPLNGIINYAQLILDRAGAVEHHQAELKGIIEEGTRIASIVSNLLVFSRPGWERFSANSLHEIVAAALQLVGTQMQREGIKIELDLSKELAEVWCLAREIQQVMLNIISNSRYALNLKFQKPDERKSIRISAREALSEAEGRHVVRLTVRDNGCGLRPGFESHLFEPFYSTKPAGQGTGLGLALSKAIIEKHKGRITIISLEGDYAEVVIELPVALKEGLGLLINCEKNS
jgi:PAS domain S-box-containing protein